MSGGRGHDWQDFRPWGVDGILLQWPAEKGLRWPAAGGRGGLAYGCQDNFKGVSLHKLYACFTLCVVYSVKQFFVSITYFRY